MNFLKKLSLLAVLLAGFNAQVKGANAAPAPNMQQFITQTGTDLKKLATQLSQLMQAAGMNSTEIKQLITALTKQVAASAQASNTATEKNMRALTETLARIEAQTSAGETNAAPQENLSELLRQTMEAVQSLPDTLTVLQGIPTTYAAIIQPLQEMVTRAEETGRGQTEATEALSQVAREAAAEFRTARVELQQERQEVAAQQELYMQAVENHSRAIGEVHRGNNAIQLSQQEIIEQQGRLTPQIQAISDTLPRLLAMEASLHRMEATMQQLANQQIILAESFDQNTHELPQTLQNLQRGQQQISSAADELVRPQRESLAAAQQAALAARQAEAQEEAKIDAEVERQSTWLRRAWRAVKETVTPNLQFLSIKKAATNPMLNLAATAAVSSKYVPEGKVKTIASWGFLLHGGYRQARALETAFTIIKNGNKESLKKQLQEQAAQKKSAAPRLNQPK